MRIINYLKSLIPEPVKAQIKESLISKNHTHFEEFLNSDGRLVFVFLAGFYQNLGDMAITCAQIHFLEDCFPDAEVIPISSHDTYAAAHTLRKSIRPSDVVTIIGGGNMSDRYLSLENCRRFVVKSFPNNRIISFPQTIEFMDLRELRRSRRIYQRHPKLTIFAREVESFRRAKAAFPGIKVALAPDIVLSMSEWEPPQERTKVLLCMRSDSEKRISAGQTDKILKTLRAEFGEVFLQDTVDVAPEDCLPDTYRDTLECFWTLLRSCKIVVTDRLHCMLFCVITGTPCVVMDNANHKISGVYDAWLRNVPYVKLLLDGDADEILEACRNLVGAEFENRGQNWKDSFEALRNAVMDSGTVDASPSVE